VGFQPSQDKYNAITRKNTVCRQQSAAGFCLCFSLLAIWALSALVAILPGVRLRGTMERDERTIWNRKYSEGSHGSKIADPFFVSACSEYLRDVPPGKALDVAGGVGRHALWLAERGWRVKLVDISEAGIELARKNMGEAASQVELEVVDLNQVRVLGREQYDLVLVFFYLQRELFPAVIHALNPGGLLLYKTYSTEQRRFEGGPSHPMHLLEPNELLKAFASLRVLHYHETVEGKGVAELAAVKLPKLP
jgi:SAM-dependent methyltransferase